MPADHYLLFVLVEVWWVSLLKPAEINLNMNPTEPHSPLWIDQWSVTNVALFSGFEAAVRSSWPSNSLPSLPLPSSRLPALRTHPKTPPFRLSPSPQQPYKVVLLLVKLVDYITLTGPTHSEREKGFEEPWGFCETATIGGPQYDPCGTPLKRAYELPWTSKVR